MGIKKYCYVVVMLYLVAVSFVTADGANVCSNYLGADMTFTQETDTGPLTSVFYGEACAFKFNIKATVHTSPWHVGISYPTTNEMRRMAETGRLDYEIYMQTVEGNAGDLTYPYGTNVVEEQVRWHHEVFGYVPSICAYQGGQYSYADFIHEYILAGRDSAPTGVYDYDFSTKINTRHYKVTTRMGDPGYIGAGISNSMAYLDQALINGGWFRDFNHWHTNPYGDAPTLYEFYEAARQHIDASGKRVSEAGTGTAIQYRWLRDISAVNIVTNGATLDVAVTYTVPDWMLTAWVPTYTNHPDEHLRPVDALRMPVSVRVDLSGTSLSGSDIIATGATSIRKLATDEFIVEVPFNRSNETVTVTLSVTGSPDYANEALPFIASISNTGTNWQIVTDQKVAMVVFTLPAGKALSEIHAVDSVDNVEAPPELRFNTMLTTHSFSVPVSTNLDYYVGLVTEESQSILVPLVPMSGEDPVITLLGDNPLLIFVGGSYVEAGATAMDNVDGDISSNIVIDASSVNTSATGTYYVTYNVTDSDSNMAVEVVRNVNVADDTTPPVITLVGDSTVYLAVGDSYVEYGATALDDKDGDVSSNIVIDASAVNTSVAGTYAVTYNVIDAAGNNAAEVVRSVEVTAALVDDFTFISHFNDINSFNINSANGDYAGGDESATVSGGSDWASGYFTNASVSVPDNKAFYFTNSASVTYDAFGGNIDYDSYTDGGITVGFWCREVNVDGGYMASALVQLGTGSGGDYLMIEYAYGSTGQMRIKYYEDGVYYGVSQVSSLTYIGTWVYFAVTVDLTAAELTLYQYDHSGNAIGAPVSVAIPGAAWDVKDDVSSLINVGGGVTAGTQCSIDEFTIDNYVLTQSDIEDRVTQMVGGSELNTGPGSPIIQLIGDNPLVMAVGDTYTEPGATAYDPEDGDISSNIVIDASGVNTSVTGTYYVTYNVIDSASNAAPEVVRTVNVATDITAPVITLLGDNPLSLTVGDTYVEAGATAADNVDGDISSNIVIDASGVNTSVAGTYSVTYNVSDTAGNTADEVVRSVVVSASTAAGFSFLAHFNDTNSWDINVKNGDYAMGSSIASVSGSPVWEDGFFPGSMPGNKALCFSDISQQLDFAGYDGNVPIPNPIGSVMTVGFWCKMTGVQKGRPILIRSGDYKNYLMFDFGNAVAGKWSIFFMDYTLDESAQVQTQIKPNIDASPYITNWMYLATVIDTGNKIAKVYQYDNEGNIIGSPYNKSLTIYSWDLTNGAATVRFNYTYVAGTTNYIDEFSIDNYELTQAEIEARVDKMVAGKELGDIPPAGMYMIIR